MFFRIIWSYLSHKPLGMQTLYDRMIKDLILAQIFAMVTTTASNVNFPVMQHYIAITIILVNFLGGVTFFLQLFWTILVRYLSIFHPIVINGNDEKEVLSISRHTTIFIGK